MLFKEVSQVIILLQTLTMYCIIVYTYLYVHALIAKHKLQLVINRCSVHWRKFFLSTATCTVGTLFLWNQFSSFTLPVIPVALRIESKNDPTSSLVRILLVVLMVPTTEMEVITIISLWYIFVSMERQTSTFQIVPSSDHGRH